MPKSKTIVEKNAKLENKLAENSKPTMFRKQNAINKIQRRMNVENDDQDEEEAAPLVDRSNFVKPMTNIHMDQVFSAISTPVSIRTLRQEKLTDNCHVIILKLLSVIKAISNMISILVQGGCIVFRLMKEKTSTKSILAYSCTFALIDLVDLISCFILLKILRKY